MRWLRRIRSASSVRPGNDMRDALFGDRSPSRMTISALGGLSTIIVECEFRVS
jgi:hypothetical protein